MAMVGSTSSPPAWSMGKSSRTNLNRKDRDYKTVGPGSYGFTLTDKKQEPKYSIGAKLG